MLTVGYERDTYAEQRLIINKVSGAAYVKVASSGRFASPVPFNESEIFETAYIQSGSCDIAHFFNQVNFGDAPYVTSFETVVPRYWRKEVFAFGMAALAKESCRKLLAMSTPPYAETEARLRLLAPAVHDKVMEKLMVLHPPQAPVPNDMERFAAPETVRFVFIGNAFFSKGGLAMFRAFERVRARFPNISLTVISAMVMGYNVTKAGARELREAASFLQRNSVWVTYYGNLPNEQVLTLLPEHHVGLLPSFAETYGYAVLEMQAAGVPVITTDIRAFPEINPDEAGWRISLPKSELRGNSPREDIVRYGVIVQQGLEKILTGIMENPAALKEKSLAAQARIRACHCPEAYGRALLAAYEGKNLA